MTSTDALTRHVVLERRELCRPSAGGVWEWRLLMDPDTLATRWAPRQVDAAGDETEPVWMPLPGSQYAFLECPIYETLYEGTRGPGKRILNTEKILTDSGWKQVGDVTRRDRLVAPDGTYTEILGIYPHASGTIHRVTFDDGATLDVDGDHLWTVRSAKNSARDGWVTKTTDELISLSSQWAGKKRSARNSWYIPTMSGPAPGSKWGGPDPYVVGLMLGDGTTGGQYATVYTCDDWIANYLSMAHGRRCYDYRPRNHAMMVQETRSGQSEVWKYAAGRNRAADKHVSEDLREADPSTRLACLQGLMDSDGSIDEQGRCRFVSLSERLAKDVQYLTRSLGGKATCYWEDRPSPVGGTNGRWRVNVQHCNKFNPFRIPRKAGRVRPMLGVDRRIESIVQIEDGQATCFEVAHPSHLFVCQDFIVTHNTLTLLWDFARDVGRGFGQAWRGVLFRREYKDLDDVSKKMDEWFPRIWGANQFRMLKSKSEYMAVWASGEALLLRTGQDEEDYDNYHGHELPWQGYEELTQWEDDAFYLKMQSCSRSTVPGIVPRRRATTNPFGVGHAWVKKRFRLGLPERGVVIREPGEMPRTAIRGVLSENFLLLHNDPSYATKLAQSTKNPNERRAWLLGDWNVTAGGMFDDLWFPQVHVLPDIPASAIPRGWTITRSYDHGSSAPFSVDWWLESNGEPIEVEGRQIGAVRGDLILWHEWYGTSGEPNTGLRMPARKIAHGIRDREEDYDVRHGDACRVIPGPADTQIFNSDADRDNRSLADDMADVGIHWERADKSPGSIQRGLQKIRDRLEGALPGRTDGTREEPGLFVCRSCPYFIELVPPAPRDRKNPDVLPEKYEDHKCDSTRYRVGWEVPGLWRRGF